MDTMERARRFGGTCGVCGEDVPYEEPLLFLRVDRHKVPGCTACCTDDGMLWGQYERHLSGRHLEVSPCSECGRTLLLYWRPGDTPVCSEFCRRQRWAQWRHEQAVRARLGWRAP